MLKFVFNANKDLLKDILPIVDDFERAINSIDKNKKEEFEGFNLINQKLISTLEKNNLKKNGYEKGGWFWFRISWSNN